MKRIKPLRYKPLPGDHVKRTVATIIRWANASGRQVHAPFNDILLVARPGSRPERLLRHYDHECTRRSDAYEASVYTRKSHIEYERAEEQKQLTLRNALASAPEHMTIRDDVAWAKWQESNKEGYGLAILRYAEVWARLMESRFGSGEAIEAIAADTSYLANTEGITGFMYGAAVKVLSDVWVHGEALRCWHNIDTQLGTEGEQANETGGVLNPAMLSLSTSSESGA